MDKEFTIFCMFVSEKLKITQIVQMFYKEQFSIHLTLL